MLVRPGDGKGVRVLQQEGGTVRRPTPCGAATHAQILLQEDKAKTEHHQQGCPGIPQPKFTLQGVCLLLQESNTKECEGVLMVNTSAVQGPGLDSPPRTETIALQDVTRSTATADRRHNGHHPGACSSAASCVEAGKFGKGSNYTSASVTKGSGNGIDCYNEDGELHTDAANVVEEMTLHDDLQVPSTRPVQFPQSSSTQAHQGDR